jgi:LytR cell envelope-related transcriptional attenuator
VSVGTTERPPVRARSGRRPLPPLIFLLVLAVAALGTWWYVLHKSDVDQKARDAACSSAAAAPPSLEPSTLTVRVLNGTDQQGLAATVAKELQSRGFTVSEFGNDSSGRKLTGVGEIRHGARGRESAAYLRVYLPGSSDYLDTRATATVDLVIGPEFKQLATPDQVAAALKPDAKADTSTC